MFRFATSALLAAIVAGVACVSAASGQTFDWEAFRRANLERQRTQHLQPRQHEPVIATVRSQARHNPFPRMVVDSTIEKGAIVINTSAYQLELGLGNGKAIRYGIGVGRQGFMWSGVQTVSRKQEWPDWIPPAEMIERQPYLPRRMAGGLNNPLGARAMYLGNTLYRIHGTNEPWTIGQNVSSGCIRLTNEDVIDLYERVQKGALVVVNK